MTFSLSKFKQDQIQKLLGMKQELVDEGVDLETRTFIGGHLDSLIALLESDAPAPKLTDEERESKLDEMENMLVSTIRSLEERGGPEDDETIVECEETLESIRKLREVS